MVSSVETGTKAKRSIPLTLLLGYFTLANVWVVVSGGLRWNSLVSHGKPNPEVPLITAAAGLLTVIVLVFVWLWRRWAVYLFALLMVVGLIATVVLGGASWVLLVSVVLLVATAWFVRAQWSSFR